MKKRVADDHETLAPELRETLIQLLTDMLLDEMQRNPVVWKGMVAEPTLCHRNSRLEKDEHYGR